MEEELLTAGQAASYLGLAVRTVVNAASTGRLRSTQRYGIRLYARGDLDAYRERTRPHGEAPRRGRPRKVV